MSPPEEKFHATPEQWAYVQRCAASAVLVYACILELRDRVKALEAAQNLRQQDEDAKPTAAPARSLVERIAARAELTQPEPEGAEVQLNWQPIATAPVDQMILVYRPDHYINWCSVAPAKYESDQYAKKPRPYWRSWLACNSKSDDRKYPPTHWMPLPSAPANEEPSQPPLQRPACFEFAMGFVGDPEETELRRYVETLEARAGLAQPEPED